MTPQERREFEKLQEIIRKKEERFERVASIIAGCFIVALFIIYIILVVKMFG